MHAPACPNADGPGVETGFSLVKAQALLLDSEEALEDKEWTWHLPARQQDVPGLPEQLWLEKDVSDHFFLLCACGRIRTTLGAAQGRLK
jgi:hypothetical protein